MAKKREINDESHDTPREQNAAEGVGYESDALFEVAERLERASQNFSQQREEFREVRSIQNDIKTVLTRIMLALESSNTLATPQVAISAPTPPPATGSMPAARFDESSGPTVSDHGGCECDCIAPGCCCFEVVLDKIRAIQPQLELPDVGDVTVPLPTVNELEVRLFVSIDKVGILIPSLYTTKGLRVPSFAVGGGPGPWEPMDNVIGRFCVKKGTSRTLTIEIQGSEIDEGAERPVAWKDEHGFATGSITLDCCLSRIYPPMPVDLSFNLNTGGTGGGIPGAISLAFYARRICC